MHTHRYFADKKRPKSYPNTHARERNISATPHAAATDSDHKKSFHTAQQQPLSRFFLASLPPLFLLKSLLHVEPIPPPFPPSTLSLSLSLSLSQIRPPTNAARKSEASLISGRYTHTHWLRTKKGAKFYVGLRGKDGA